jgi:hypothetical protein
MYNITTYYYMYNIKNANVWCIGPDETKSPRRQTCVHSPFFRGFFLAGDFCCRETPASRSTPSRRRARLDTMTPGGESGGQRERRELRPDLSSVSTSLPLSLLTRQQWKITHKSTCVCVCFSEKQVPMWRGCIPVPVWCNAWHLHLFLKSRLFENIRMASRVRCLSCSPLPCRNINMIYILKQTYTGNGLT